MVRVNMDETAVKFWQDRGAGYVQIPGGAALRLNMDETTLRLFYDAAKGVIANEPPSAQAGRRGRLAQKATRGQTRGALSLIALLCDDSSVQPRLPQYVIGNEQVLPASLVTDLLSGGRLFPNVRLLRRKSAWVNDAALAATARHWGEVLAEVSVDRQPILLLDACSAHLGPGSWRCAGVGAEPRDALLGSLQSSCGRLRMPTQCAESGSWLRDLATWSSGYGISLSLGIRMSRSAVSSCSTLLD